MSNNNIITKCCIYHTGIQTAHCLRHGKPPDCVLGDMSITWTCPTTSCMRQLSSTCNLMLSLLMPSHHLAVCSYSLSLFCVFQLIIFGFTAHNFTKCDSASIKTRWTTDGGGFLDNVRVSLSDSELMSLSFVCAMHTFNTIVCYPKLFKLIRESNNISDWSTVNTERESGTFWKDRWNLGLLLAQRLHRH